MSGMGDESNTGCPLSASGLNVASVDEGGKRGRRGLGVAAGTGSVIVTVGSQCQQRRKFFVVAQLSNLCGIHVGKRRAWRTPSEFLCSAMNHDLMRVLAPSSLLMQTPLWISGIFALDVRRLPLQNEY